MSTRGVRFVTSTVPAIRLRDPGCFPLRGEVALGQALPDRRRWRRVLPYGVEMRMPGRSAGVPMNSIPAASSAALASSTVDERLGGTLQGERKFLGLPTKFRPTLLNLSISVKAVWGNVAND
jgi:hypothetical protein